MLQLIALLVLLINGNGMAENCDYNEMMETFRDCLFNYTTALFSNGTFEYYCGNNTAIAFNSCVESAMCIPETDQAELMETKLGILTGMLPMVSNVNSMLHLLFCDAAHPCNAVSLQNCFPTSVDLQQKVGEMMKIMAQNNATEVLRNSCKPEYVSHFNEFDNCWNPPMEKSLSCFQESPQKNSIDVVRFLHGFIALDLNSLPILCATACFDNFETAMAETVECFKQAASTLKANQEMDVTFQCGLVGNFSSCVMVTLKENQCLPLWDNFVTFIRSISYARDFLEKCSAYLQTNPNLYGILGKTTIPEKFRTASMKPLDNFARDRVNIETTTWPDKPRKATINRASQNFKKIPDNSDFNNVGRVEEPQSLTTLSPARRTTASSAPEDSELTLSIVLSAVILAVVIASGI